MIAMLLAILIVSCNRLNLFLVLCFGREALEDFLKSTLPLIEPESQHTNDVFVDVIIPDCWQQEPVS